MKAPQVIWPFWLFFFIFSAKIMASDTSESTLPPVVEAVISGDLCEDGIVTVTLSGADTYVWTDDNSTVNPRDFDLPAGNYSFEVTGFDSSDGSSTTINVDFEILESPNPIILPTDGLICEGNSLTLTAIVDPTSTWEWSTGDVDAPTISVSPDSSTFFSITETNNGCSGTFQVMVSVQFPLAAPEITCGEVSTDSIQFVWNSIPNATGYQIDVPSGHAGVQVDDTTFIVNNLSPDEMVTIEVTSLGTLCGGQLASFSCSSDECYALELELTPAEDICLSPLQPELVLEAITNDTTDFGLGWWTGTGITDTLAGNFDPVSAGIGTHEVFFHYEIGQCSYLDSMEINIFEIPTSGFSLNMDSICQDASVLATYDDTVDPSLIFSWNFGSGISNQDSDEAGPHEITWDQSGNFQVSLQVSNDHCTAESETQMVAVFPPLGIPEITCESSTTSSVTFSWNDVANAVTYSVLDIDGPPGMLNGSTYTVTNLQPEESVSIEVTALSDGICSNTIATGTCQTDACPTVTVEVTGPDTVCINEPVAFDLNVFGSSDGFEVTYQVNGETPESIIVNNDQTLPIFNITETSTLSIISFTNQTATECQYAGSSTWTIVVNEPLTAGEPTDPIELCANEGQTIILSDLLIDENTGGLWSETSASPSAGNAFNAGSGTFNTVGQMHGTYNFTYEVTSPAPCPNDIKEVSVIIHPVPLADAGQDQEIACDLDVVTLDGSASTTDMQYFWTAPNGIILQDPTSISQETGQSGIYTLEVTNNFGCSSRDEVFVSEVSDLPELTWTVQDISCFDAQDGSIAIETISGGSPPYNLTILDEVYSEPLTITELGPGTYPLSISDANFCSNDYWFTIEEPEAIEVNLVSYPSGNNTLEYGDTIQLSINYTAEFPIDTIIWRPEGINVNGQTSVNVNPLVSTPYSVLLIDENGCMGEDELNIFVEKSRPAYIPNVFSPNNDGINDHFYIQGTDAVIAIRSLSIFDRWGNHVFSTKDALPNDIAAGWDGKYKGQHLPPAVYTFYAEIEFKSGETELFFGNLTLVR
ncbi:MAG: hypothetical protein DWQ02_23450 [Bacteroidetes bacterium]|nr:MAG: hypothetical protein DWQ02_23450 [Bacteroidota bacterium]